MSPLHKIAPTLVELNLFLEQHRHELLTMNYTNDYLETNKILIYQNIPIY
jgi:hypothetical protein